MSVRECDVDRRTFSVCTFSRVKSSTSIHKLIAHDNFNMFATVDATSREGKVCR